MNRSLIGPQCGDFHVMNAHTFDAGYPQIGDRGCGGRIHKINTVIGCCSRWKPNTCGNIDTIKITPAHVATGIFVGVGNAAI